MNARIRNFVNDERGITAVETAIILIAFVVVGAIFAFTVLSTGTFLTERSKEAAYAGLAEVRGSAELRGSVIATSTVTDTVATVVFTLSNVAGGSPIDLTDTLANQVVNLSYRDKSQMLNLNTAAKWTVVFLGKNNNDKILDPLELAEITVDLDTITTPLGPNTIFQIEFKPPHGATLLIERTTPSRIDAVTDLK